MKVIDIPVFWMIFLDIVAWFIIHISAAFLASRLPNRCFYEDSVMTRTRKWERDGQIWDDLFKVKKWKERLPDGAAAFKQGFRKKNLAVRDSEYYRRFIMETRRAELTHWLTIAPALIFFLWNPFGVVLIMIVFVLGINLPCIIAQRYNRPRLIRLIDPKKVSQTVF